MKTQIEDIRDLLISTVAPEMAMARDGGLMARRYMAEDLTYDEAIVAWVLDAMTIKSLQLLIELRTKPREPLDGG